jgi:NlpC/P60 family
MQKQIRPDLMKKRLICCLCSAAIAITASLSLAGESHTESLLSSFGLNERRFTEEVKEYLGIPYRKGGTTKKGMDCSGFARTVYDRLLGIDLPQSSADQFQSRELDKIDTRELQTGDLVFFGGGKKKKRINHVGVYLSDGQFIHASTSEGVMVSSLSDQYWRKRYVGSKRHHVLNSLEELGENRADSLVEAQVSDSGVLSFYASTSNKTDSLSENNLTPQVQAYQASPVGDYNASNEYREASFSHNLFDGFDLSLSAFHQSANRTSSITTSLIGEHSATAMLDDSLHGSSRQGLTFAGDYRASDWLILTPSITYFDQGGDDNLAFLPKRSFGLNTQLFSLDNRWSLSMLMNYNEGDSRNGLHAFDNKLNSFDLAFKLGISLTDNLQMSIMSKYDNRSSALRSPDDGLLNDSGGGDVAMMFAFSY